MPYYITPSKQIVGPNGAPIAVGSNTITAFNGVNFTTTTSTTTSSTTTTTTIASGNLITLTVNLTGASSPKTTYPVLKYNKSSCFQMDMDDRGQTMTSVQAILHGGVAPLNGVSYPGITSSDNAGGLNSYRAGIAINAKDNGGNVDRGTSLNELSWAALASLINDDFPVENHGYYHDETGTFNNGTNFIKNIDDNTIYAWTNLNANSVQFITRTWVTPNADDGYMAAAESLGYLAGTSQSQRENLPAFPMAEYYPAPSVESFEKQSFVQLGRNFIDQTASWNDTIMNDPATGIYHRIDTMLASATSSYHPILRLGTHSIEATHCAALFNYIKTHSSDTCWVTSMHEFMEYLEMKKKVIKTETLVGSVLTITLDYTNVPDAARYRDLSLLLTGGTIVSVTQSGANNLTYNPSTGLINVYRKKTTGFTAPVARTYAQNVPIPLVKERFYQLQSFDVDPTTWIDGSTTTPFNPGFGGILDPVKINYEFPQGFIFHKLTLFDDGAGAFTPVTTITAIRKSDQAEIPIGTFNGAGLNVNVNISTTFPVVIDRLIFTGGRGTYYGNELTITGDYDSTYVDPTSFAARPKRPFRYMAGVNLYPWNLQQDPNNPSDSSTIYAPKLTAFQNTLFSAARDYMDWNQFEKARGLYAFDGTYPGWRNDLMMSTLKSIGVERLLCYQGRPDYMQNSYIVGSVDYSVNIPTAGNYTITFRVATSNPNAKLQFQSGLGAILANVTVPNTGGYQIWANAVSASITLPAGIQTLRVVNTSLAGSNFALNYFTFAGAGSLTVQAEAYAASVGDVFTEACSDTGAGQDIVWGDQRMHYIPVMSGADPTLPASYIDSAKMVWQLTARYGRVSSFPAGSTTLATLPSYQPQNTVQYGLNTVNYIETGNEDDSDFYGQGLNMKLLSYGSGLKMAARLSAEYDGHLNSMGAGVGMKNADPSMKFVIPAQVGPSRDWLRAIHDWSRVNRGLNADGTINLPYDIINYHKYSAVSGDKGYAPEVVTTDTVSQMARYIDFSNRRAQGREVWITEYGWDTQAGSDFRAAIIGSKSIYITQADWTIRYMLEASANFIDRCFYFQLYDDTPGGQGRFNTTGILNNDSIFSRRPVGDYIRQLVLLIGNYSFNQRVSVNPRVDKYTLAGQNDMYVCWSPTGNATSGSYSLSFPSNPQIRLWNFVVGADTMTSSLIQVSGGAYLAPFSETPAVIEVLGTPVSTTSTTTAASTTTTTTASSGLHQSLVTVPIDSFGHTQQGWLHLPSDYATATSRVYPVIIFFHGVGEAGTNPNTVLNQGLPLNIKNGMLLDDIINPADSQPYSFIVLACQDQYWSPSQDTLPYQLAWLQTNYRVDANRIYTSGLSAGGEDSFYCAVSPNATVASIPSAVVSMSPAPLPSSTGAYDITQIATYGTRTWFFCGNADPNGFLVNAQNYNTACNAQVAGSSQLTVYSGGHCCWSTYYDTAYSDPTVHMNIYQWMLQFKKSAATTTTTTAAPTTTTTTTAGPTTTTTTTTAGPTTTTTTSSTTTTTTIAPLRTIKMNLGSQFVTSPTTWNNIAVSTPSTGYTSGNLVTSTGGATTVTLSMVGLFSGATGSAPTPGTANSGIYPDLVVSSALTSGGGGTESSLQINGLDPTKYYKIHLLGNAENFNNAIVNWHVGSTRTPNVTENSNYGLSTDTEDSSTAIRTLKNIVPSGGGAILIEFTCVSGGGWKWNSIVLKEYSSPLP